MLGADLERKGEQIGSNLAALFAESLYQDHDLRAPAKSKSTLLLPSHFFCASLAVVWRLEACYVRVTAGSPWCTRALSGKVTYSSSSANFVCDLPRCMNPLLSSWHHQLRCEHARSQYAAPDIHVSQLSYAGAVATTRTKKSTRTALSGLRIISGTKGGRFHPVVSPGPSWASCTHTISSVTLQSPR